MKTLAGVGLALLTLSASASSAAASLDELVQSALSTHPLMAAARSRIEASDHERQATVTQRYPTASVQTDYDGRFAGQLRVQQVIWNGGLTTAQIRQAEANQRGSEIDLQNQQQQVANRIVDAWQALLSAQLRQDISADQLKQLDHYKALMKRRVDAGVSAAIEMELVISRQLQQQVEYEAARAEVQLGLERLEQLTGQTVMPSWPAQAALNAELAAAQSRDGPLDRSSWPTVQQNHPSVLRADADIAAADATIAIYRAQQRPSLYWQYQKRLNPSRYSVNTDGFGLGMQFSTGFDSGLHYRAQAASAQKEALIAEREAKRRLVMDQLQADWQRYRSAQSRLQVLMEALRGSRLVEDSYARQFIAGRKSWLEVLNANRETAQNELALADAQVTLVAASYRLRLNEGQLDWQQQGETHETR